MLLRWAAAIKIATRYYSGDTSEVSGEREKRLARACLIQKTTNAGTRAKRAEYREFSINAGRYRPEKKIPWVNEKTMIAIKVDAIGLRLTPRLLHAHSISRVRT